MVEGFFLDRIDLKGGRRGVTEAVEFPVLIDANVAKTGLTVADVAVARAEITVNAAVGFGLPPECFAKLCDRLEDLESGHKRQPLLTLYARVCGEASGTAGTTPNGSPIGEGFQVLAIFPGELQKPYGIEIGSFIAEKGFKAPLDVRAFPGLKTIAR
jgi:hypothetical protein